VDGVSFDIEKGETVGLVGESGSGKTVTALSIMRLVPFPGRIVNGNIFFKGENLLEKTEYQMRSIRGSGISMIFQDPMTFLNPVFRVGEQIAESIKLHQKLGKDDAMEKAIKTLELVQIPPDRAFYYPHQLSGGMRQRVLLAIAISCNPDLLIADEPTTALDVIVQSEVLDLLKKLKNSIGMSTLLITHDLGITWEMANKVIIIYAGNIMEYGDVKTIFNNAQHPYTLGLLESIPKIDQPRLKSIDGNPPNMINPPQGCRFHPRCRHGLEKCHKQKPILVEIERGHFVSCFRFCKT
jgi:peptide/nickel transport system ATP-binding protein/oligopeptide transport system ATP-binding protein